MSRQFAYASSSHTRLSVPALVPVAEDIAIARGACAR
jgi:hypothetical protein